MGSTTSRSAMLTEPPKKSDALPSLGGPRHRSSSGRSLMPSDANEGRSSKGQQPSSSEDVSSYSPYVVTVTKTKKHGSGGKKGKSKHGDKRRNKSGGHHHREDDSGRGSDQCHCEDSDCSLWSLDSCPFCKADHGEGHEHDDEILSTESVYTVVNE